MDTIKLTLHPHGNKNTTFLKKSLKWVGLLLLLIFLFRIVQVNRTEHIISHTWKSGDRTDFHFNPNSPYTLKYHRVYFNDDLQGIILFVLPIPGAGRMFFLNLTNPDTTLFNSIEELNGK